MAKVSIRLDFVCLSGLDQTIERGCGMCAGRAPIEKPVFPSNAEWPNCIFNCVGVGREVSRFEIPYQLGPLAEPIFDGFSQE